MAIFIRGLEKTEYMRRWQQENLNKGREATKKWRQKNPLKAKASERASNKKRSIENPETPAHSRIRRLRVYGLTPEDVDKLLLEQDSKCAICLTPVKLCVDHCHKTNKVRGLLCQTCNAGLGQFKDSPENLHAAIVYLIRDRK